MNPLTYSWNILILDTTTCTLFCQTEMAYDTADKWKLKHTTTLFPLSDHYILSREWRVIVDQGQTNYHGRPVVQ